MKLLAATLLAAVTLAQGAAAETAAINVTHKGQANNSYTALAENNIAIQLASDFGSEGMAETPMAGMGFSCFGSIHIMVPGASGGGLCVWADDSGMPRVVSNWTATGMAADGAITGTWTILSANGDLEGLNGGGTFASLTDRDTGAVQLTTMGAVSLP